MSRPINHPPRYTVQDSLGGTDERRDELIDGAVWRMAPASVLLQQSIAGSPHAQRYNQLVDKARTVADHPALVFAAPVDVVPGPSTVVQPDVVLVCDPAKLANGRYTLAGRPSWCSRCSHRPRRGVTGWSSATLYERVGVAHYGIVDPEAATLECYWLNAGRYGKPDVYAPGEVLDLPYSDGMRGDLTELFGSASPPRSGPDLQRTTGARQHATSDPPGGLRFPAGAPRGGVHRLPFGVRIPVRRSPGGGHPHPLVRGDQLGP